MQANIKATQLFRGDIENYSQPLFEWWLQWRVIATEIYY